MNVFPSTLTDLLSWCRTAAHTHASDFDRYTSGLVVQHIGRRP